MDYIERNSALNKLEFVGRIRIALCDWLGYWTSVGTSSITDPDLKAKMDEFILAAIRNTDVYLPRLSKLIIADPAVKDAVEITDANVQTALTNVLSRALDYIL